MTTHNTAVAQKVTLKKKLSLTMDSLNRAEAGLFSGCLTAKWIRMLSSFPCLGAALLSPARGCGRPVLAKLATAFCGGRLRPVSAELGVAELVGACVARPALQSVGLFFWLMAVCALPACVKCICVAVPVFIFTVTIPGSFGGHYMAA